MNARTAVDRFLSAISRGHLTIKDDKGPTRSFGKSGSGLSATMIVHDPAFYQRVLSDGSLGLGEAYMDGQWDAKDGDIMSCIGILLADNLSENVRLNATLATQALLHRFAANASRKRSSKNIRSHYDVGNDMYELFLDKNMAYTCGYQKHSDDTIEQMQDQKHERLSQKLGLKKSESLIDLGCGFGGMLRYSAKNYGINGIGVTLSEGQHEWATNKIRDEKLQKNIEIQLRDYRDMDGTFDKLVSIGLAEHTWQRGYDVFIDKAASLLKDGGIGLIHTIGTTADPKGYTDPWILKYIFPDGRLPRLEEMIETMRRKGLTVGHVENLKPHYAETLRHWKEKFNRNHDRIHSLDPKKYDEKFLRMWDYYLQVCEAGFRHGDLQLYQILFCKGDAWTLPERFEF